MENNRYREEEKEETVEKDETVIEDEKAEVTDTKEETVEKVTKKNKYKEKIKTLEEELANVKNEMLKDRAELENFKRRINDERIKDRIYANQSLVTDLIEITDIFDKAVSKQPEDEVLKKYLLGFSMINTQIQQIMENYGVKKIDALNKPFNPSYHEAIETKQVEGVEPNTVVEVVREGYMFKDRIIRPSMVKVSE